MVEWDESADFVVIGSGGGSMCAGLVLRDLGKSVVVLEKTDKVGGSTAMSGGVLWGTDLARLVPEPEAMACAAPDQASPGIERAAGARVSSTRSPTLTATPGRRPWSGARPHPRSAW